MNSSVRKGIVLLSALVASSCVWLDNTKVGARPVAVQIEVLEQVHAAASAPGTANWSVTQKPVECWVVDALAWHSGRSAKAAWVEYLDAGAEQSEGGSAVTLREIRSLLEAGRSGYLKTGSGTVTVPNVRSVAVAIVGEGVYVEEWDANIQRNVKLHVGEE